ncbi:MAG: hypothetical protein ACRD19_16380 [Terriglobia bacterium]
MAKPWIQEIQKKIITDEAKTPVAVQIDYADWLEIERYLKLGEVRSNRETDLSRFSGVISLTEDPLDYQVRLRGEWR